jgi:exodeoxyribonuclease-5
MRRPDLKLVKIHRQARKNPIILFSRHVRKTGELSQDFEDAKHIFFDSKSNLDEVLTEAYENVESAIDVAILCWTNRARIRLNIAARKALGYKGAPHRGELLICLKNMRDANADIYNGMRGVVNSDCFFIDGEWAFDCSVGFPEESILPRTLSLCAPQFFRERVFESVEELNDRGIDVDSMSGLALFDMGYALTTHKAQGSQAKHVIVWIEEGAQSDAKFWKRWLYTSVTRASEKLTILV